MATTISSIPNISAHTGPCSGKPPKTKIMTPMAQPVRVNNTVWGSSLPKTATVMLPPAVSSHSGDERHLISWVMENAVTSSTISANIVIINEGVRYIE